MIPFNKPYTTGKEIAYIEQVLASGHLSGNNHFSKKCQDFFENRYNIPKTLLTTSCTDALEMCAMLIDIQPGDEVIIPSYTFVSTALSFVRQGAKIIFADSHTDQPNIDETKLQTLITPKTKAIVVVHYAGVACEMDTIMTIAKERNIFVIEDAAQAIESTYKGTQLGTVGDLGTFSFHETKNVQCGEGGLLLINNPTFIKRAEVIWEKGTNRQAFFNGEVDKYGWVDTGSSYLPSDILAAVLYAQLEEIDEIQQQRKAIWQQYYDYFINVDLEAFFSFPSIPSYATNNGHMFYLVCKSQEQRTQLISKLKSKSIHAVFHYQSLHKSAYYKNKLNQNLVNSDMYTDQLVRLPLFFELSKDEVDTICKAVASSI